MNSPFRINANMCLADGSSALDEALSSNASASDATADALADSQVQVLQRQQTLNLAIYEEACDHPPTITWQSKLKDIIDETRWSLDSCRNIGKTLADMAIDKTQPTAFLNEHIQRLDNDQLHVALRKASDELCERSPAPRDDDGKLPDADANEARAAFVRQLSGPAQERVQAVFAEYLNAQQKAHAEH